MSPDVRAAVSRSAFELIDDTVDQIVGHLATFVVLLIYVWLLANAFLAGIQLDACVRECA